MKRETDLPLFSKEQTITIFMVLLPFMRVTLDPSTLCQISELPFIWLLIIRAVK